MLALFLPNEIYGELFEDIQKSAVFNDSKLFVDAVPCRQPQNILEDYQQQKSLANFNLAQFIESNFKLPKQRDQIDTPNTDSLRDYIHQTWQVLQRSDDGVNENSSLIKLPKPYVVPGGRFREVYYWDSYFTMLGLAEDGNIDMVCNMVDNFAYLIDQFGFIPNANRSYYCTRSQPPFFAMMVDLLAERTQDPSVYQSYIKQLQKEYDFWMAGHQALNNNGAHRHVIKLENGFLNRYWDDSALPRSESYSEDLHIASDSKRQPEQLYRDIRAGAESGYDFSSRWFADQTSLDTINTTNIIPIDLNCLMHHLETTLAYAYQLTKQEQQANHFKQRAEQRHHLIQTLFFDQSAGYFSDLNLSNLTPTGVHSLAGSYPLYFNLATQQQADKVADKLTSQFLKSAGWVETNNHTHQQWDAPNGWAPSQWAVSRGLINYGHQQDAHKGMQRWVKNVNNIYQQRGILLEKYNVEEPGKFGDGGEYQVQHGFGWTNAVSLCFMNELNL